MIRLVRVEILRLWSRRLFKMAAVGVLLLIALIVGIDAANSAKTTPAAEAAWQERSSAAYDKDLAFQSQQQPAGQPPDAQLPSREEVANGDGCIGPNTCQMSRQEPYLVRTKLPEFGIVVAVICAFAGFFIGASAAGAEWSAGTMQSLLYWEPRRIRVVLAKVLGLVTLIGLLVVVAQALFSAGALAAGQARGSTAGITSGIWTSYLLLVLRAMAFAGFAAVLGFSIAFGSRVTAAAVGIAFVYFAILEQLLVNWKLWLAKYAIAPLLGAWLNNGIDIGVGGDRTFALTGQRAGLTLAAYAVGMLTIATLWFRQRDVA